MGAENTRFNANLYLDIMYTKGAPAQHIVDAATHFSAAQFVHSLTTEAVWETTLTLWATVYTGLPRTLVFDDVSQFRDNFVEICEIHDVEWQRLGMQHHSALGIGERYREPVRRTFREPRMVHTKMKK